MRRIKSLCLAVALLLTACGQTGGLYLPGTQSPYGPPHYSPLHGPYEHADAPLPSDQNVP